MRKLSTITRRTFNILIGVKLGLLTTATRANNGPDEHIVTIRRFKFKPSKLEIKSGDTVIWKNKDSAPHTATDLGETWDTGEISKSESISLTFDQDGEFEYVCRYHPHMKAVLKVRN